LLNRSTRRSALTRSETLKKHLNIDCRSDDVLVRDDQGYHLNHEKISVRIVPDEDAFCCAENVPPTGLDVPPTGLDVPPTGQNVPPIQQNVPSNVPSIAADVPSTGVNVPSMGKNVPASTENVPSNVPPTGLDVPPTGQNVPSISTIAGTEVETAGGNGLNGRQKWIVQQIEAGENVTRSQVEEKFGVSDKTAKRDLAQLVSKMMIQYVRKPHPGHYVRMR